MTRARVLTLVFGLVALALVASSASAADKPAKGKLKTIADQLTSLLPDGVEAKLQLTDDQKKQIAKIEEEYREKSKEAVGKLRDEFSSKQESLKKAREDKDKAALRDALVSLRDPLTEYRKVRGEYRDKVKAVLNDEQKKTFDEVVSSEGGPVAKLNQLLNRKKNNNP